MKPVARQLRIGRRATLLCVMASCFLTGCWEEIEYTGPDPATAQRAATPPDETTQAANVSPEPLPPQTASTDNSNSEASGFADELANSIAGETPPPGDTFVAADPAEPTSDTGLLPFETSDNYEAADDTTSQTPVSDDVTLPNEAENETTEPVDAVPDTAGALPSNTRLDAWLLGSHLSLAALAHDRGIAAENVQKWLESAKKHAATLEVTVTELPEAGATGGSQTTSRQVLTYLFVQGQQIGREVATRHGADRAALIEVALKSNLLRVLYSPGSGTTEAIGGAIAQAAPRAELPASLWQPLVDLLAAKADPAEVRKAVQSFHAEVERHLSPAAEQ